MKIPTNLLGGYAAAALFLAAGGFALTQGQNDCSALCLFANGAQAFGVAGACLTAGFTLLAAILALEPGRLPAKKPLTLRDGPTVFSEMAARNQAAREARAAKQALLEAVADKTSASSPGTKV